MARRKKPYFQPAVMSVLLSAGGVCVCSPNSRARELGEQGLVARVSIGFQDHDNSSHVGMEHDLVSEYLSGKTPVPWRSADHRDSALRILPSACWIDRELRQKLISHIRRTPWYEHSFTLCDTISQIEFIPDSGCMLQEIPDCEARSGEVLVPVRWSTGNHDDVPGGALDEAMRGLLPIPWLSVRHRQLALTDIAESRFFREISEPVRTQLIEHIAATPAWDCDADLRTPFDRRV